MDPICDIKISNPNCVPEKNTGNTVQTKHTDTGKGGNTSVTQSVCDNLNMSKNL